MLPFYLRNMNNIIKKISIKNYVVQENDTVIFESNEPNFALFAKSIYKNYTIDYSKFYKMSHLSKLGFLAAELLLQGQDYSDLAPEDISLIIANSSSSLHTDIEYQSSIESIPSPSVFVYTLPNIVIGEICIRHNFKGEGCFFIQNKFDYDFINTYVSELFKTKKTRMCIYGWLEIDTEENFEAELYLARS